MERLPQQRFLGGVKVRTDGPQRSIAEVEARQLRAVISTAILIVSRKRALAAQQKIGKMASLLPLADVTKVLFGSSIAKPQRALSKPDLTHIAPLSHQSCYGTLASDDD